jgi:hypothetical protein
MFWALCSVLVWLQTRHSAGPFVFPDEAVYWEMVKALRDRDVLGAIYQYNPLYPLVVSFVLRFLEPLGRRDLCR